TIDWSKETEVSGVSPSDVNLTLTCQVTHGPPTDPVSVQVMVAVTMSLIDVVPGSRSTIARAPVICWPGDSIKPNACCMKFVSAPSNNVAAACVPTWRVSEAGTGVAKASAPSIGNEPRVTAVARPNFAPLIFDEKAMI